MRTDGMELPIIDAAYEFNVWLSQRVAGFPRSQRYAIGARLEQKAGEILEALIRAKYTSQRQALLEQANVDLELLRFQTRLAKDLGCLTVKSYGVAARYITEIGQQLGV